MELTIAETNQKEILEQQLNNKLQNNQTQVEHVLETIEKEVSEKRKREIEEIAAEL